MIKNSEVIHKLIERYDYGGAYDLLLDESLEDTDPGHIINSCRYAVNFDFDRAVKHLNKLSEEMRKHKTIEKTYRHLLGLIRGEPEAIFSELMENVKIQIVGEEYIDFLGRVYRFKEAIYKFMFLRTVNSGKKIYFVNDMVLKRNILRVLKKQYKIYNNSTIYGISDFIQRYQKQNEPLVKVDRILSTNKMNELIELRHSSIIGHGFKGVSEEDIYRIYGNPYHVLDDYEDCLEILKLKIDKYKYARLNELISRLLIENGLGNSTNE
ncbi:MAG: hypothetical protein AVO33_03680 [delta proteobacterium ML8_F1]|nr:MAG: hypothetical protein AVO33_03680 [delta proteobacterium ML8_F1]